MRIGWSLASLAVWLLTGCGEDDACRVELGDADGAVATRSAVPEPEGCVAGGVGDGELSGRWHLWVDTTPPSTFRFSFPRLEATCDGGLALPGGWADGYDEVRTELTSDELFWRRAWTDDEGVEHAEATRACVTADGSLAASVVRCQNLACESVAAHLTRFGRIAGESEGDGLRLVGETAGTSGAAWSLNVRARGGYAYVAQRPGTLRVFDVRDPAAPREVGVYVHEGATSADFNDLKLVEAGDRRYAILAGAATPIIDVTDPAAPVWVREIGEYSHSVFIDEQGGRQLLHLATYGRDVPVFDVTDPLAPAPLGRAQGPKEMATHDLFADDGLLYANGIDGQFVVIDARTSIGQATVLGSVPALSSHASWVGTVGERRIALHGDEGRDAHLRIFDADPASPSFLTELGSWRTRPEVSIHNLMLVGSDAYIAHYQDGIRVVDVSDPAAPRTRAYFNVWDADTGDIGAFSGAVGLDVDAVAGLIYVADFHRGLLVLSTR